MSKETEIEPEQKAASPVGSTVLVDARRVVAIAAERGEFVTDVDGYLYWWPTGSCGHYSSHHLRWLAEHLDRENMVWDKQVADCMASTE